MRTYYVAMSKQPWFSKVSCLFKNADVMQSQNRHKIVCMWPITHILYIAMLTAVNVCYSYHG